MGSPKKEFSFDLLMLLLIGAFQLRTGIRLGLLATPASGALLLLGGLGMWLGRFWGRPVAVIALLTMSGLYGWNLYFGGFSWGRGLAAVFMIVWAWIIWSGGRRRAAELRSALHAPLERGLDPGADLAKELRALGDFKPRTKADGDAVVSALKRALELPPAKNRFDSPLHAIVGLFQDVEDLDSGAFEVLVQDGLPLLVRRLEARMAVAGEEEADDLLLILKLLVMYQHPASGKLLVRAARVPLKPEHYLWSIVFRTLAPGHPQAEFVHEQLRDPIPAGFIAVALLDGANQAAIDGEPAKHPFDGPSGKARLREWLSDDEPERYSYAHSATAALPFIHGPERDALFALAMDHADVSVQLEAAWASAKLGNDSGVRSLAEYCLDVQRSSTASRYLKELGREAAIPREALDPDFQARAEFAQWLAHPNELARPPDEVEVVDTRELRWPPEGELKRFWVIRYRAAATDPLGEEDVDCGLVGSMTFCLFSYHMDLRPPEDVYAIHCAWELSKDDLIAESDPDSPEEYAGTLRQWSGRPLQGAKVVRVAELSAKLAYPQPLVALATATLDGKEGWAVLDGPRSAWYPKSEQPEEDARYALLRIHIGRILLGFSEPPDRAPWLARKAPPRPPAEVCARYEALLAEARRSPNPSLKAQVGSLGSHLEAYAAARAAVRGEPKEGALARSFEDLLALVQANSALFGKEIFSNFEPIGKNVYAYGDALVAEGAVDRVTALIDLVEPHWDHNLGYGQLGVLAHKAGLNDRAEAFFLKLRASFEGWLECEELDRLARLWHGKGLKEDARRLLVDGLAGLVKKGREARGSEREQVEKRFQERRRTCLELFPESGEAGLPAWHAD